MVEPAELVPAVDPSFSATSNCVTCNEDALMRNAARQPQQGEPANATKTTACIILPDDDNYCYISSWFIAVFVVFVTYCCFYVVVIFATDVGMLLRCGCLFY